MKINIISYMKLLKNSLSVMKNWFIQEWLVVVLAICVSLLYVLPYYITAFSLGPDYRGMPLLIQDAEGEYLLQIRELQEGHYSIASPVFYEYKDWPGVIPSTGHWIYYFPTLVFGISTVSVDMIYKFLLPIVLFLLIYIFLKNITNGSRFWSIVGALLVVIGFDLPSVHFIKKLLFGDFSWYLAPWTRPVNPITGMLALAGYLIFIYKIFIGKSKKFIIPGILMSVMIGYFFSFVYAGVLTVSLLVISWIAHHSKDRVIPIGKVLLTGVVFVLMLAGPVIYALVFKQDVGGLNDPLLSGLFYTHLPIINKTSLLLTFFFFLLTYVVYRRSKEKLWLENWWLFCLGLLASNQIVYNIQIVLGWTVWPAHFVQFTNVAVSLVLIIVLSKIGDKLSSKISRSIGWVIVCLLALILGRTLSNYQIFIPTLEKFQTYQPIMSWLDTRGGEKCVALVVQDENKVTLRLNRFIPGFTNCDVYHSMHIYQGAPKDRVFHNVLVWLWMQGITEKELPEFLERENFFVRSYLFRDWVDLFCCGGDPWVAKLRTKEEQKMWYEDLKKDVEVAYRDFLEKDISSELARYRLDYVIVDKTTRFRNGLDRIRQFKKIYEDDSFIMYRFSL